jgi:predicted Rossmann fold nucleotide-binding protein DprA/Smf involved in DNA uptake
VGWSKPERPVSQFSPDAPPTRWSFPLRSIVMSGMAVGTVVVEANSTSGAKNQATHALDHQKRLFLLESLVTRETWARRYVERGAQVVHSVDDILSTLVSMARAPEQLTLNLSACRPCRDHRSVHLDLHERSSGRYRRVRCLPRSSAPGPPPLHQLRDHDRAG